MSKHGHLVTETFIAPHVKAALDQLKLMPCFVPSFIRIPAHAVLITQIKTLLACMNVCLFCFRSSNSAPSRHATCAINTI